MPMTPRTAAMASIVPAPEQPFWDNRNSVVPEALRIAWCRVRTAATVAGRRLSPCFEMERARRFERPTPTLARLCSTPELRPRSVEGAAYRRASNAWQGGGHRTSLGAFSRRLLTWALGAGPAA